MLADPAVLFYMCEFKSQRTKACLENLNGVEYDRVDPRKLLEEHQTERDQNWLQVTLLEDFHQRALRNIAFAFGV